jgi:hypothetical protein
MVRTCLFLQQGGLITSYYEGKTRLYQFCPSYPLINELELLLKKAYTLLPANTKKEYYAAQEEPLKSHLIQDNKAASLLSFWNRLSTISRLTFHAKTKSKEENTWQGKGVGEVSISKDRSNILIFNERGSWQNGQGSQHSFSNTYRWTLDRSANVISLEHLRHGPENPVFLFHLALSGKQSLTSIDSHLCEGDTYFGQIHFDRFNIRLKWRVIGPKKNEEIDYFYS